MIKKDSLGRVDRYSEATLQTDVSHYITPRDVKWLHFLRQHGGRLTTSYFHELTSKDLKSKLTTSRRLKILARYFKLIYRPLNQRSPISRNHDLIYCLTKKGEKFLNSLSEGPSYQFGPRVKRSDGDFEHEVMSSCISASIELNTVGTEFEVLNQHELGVDITMGELIPDGVQMLKKPGKSTLLFREEDRGTEPLDSDDTKRKTIKKNLTQWKEVIEDGLYKDHFKVGTDCGAFLLFSTVNDQRIKNIQQKIMKEVFPKGCNYILFSSFPDMGYPFRAPKVLNVLNRPWIRYKNDDLQFLKSHRVSPRQILLKWYT